MSCSNAGGLICCHQDENGMFNNNYRISFNPYFHRRFHETQNIVVKPWTTSSVIRISYHYFLPLQLLLTFMVVVTSQVACYGLPLFQPRPDRNHRLLELSEARQRNIGLFRVLSQPTNTRNIRLWSRNRNVFLQVNANGVVNGTHESNNRYSKFS